MNEFIGNRLCALKDDDILSALTLYDPLVNFGGRRVWDSAEERRALVAALSDSRVQRDFPEQRQIQVRTQFVSAPAGGREDL